MNERENLQVLLLEKAVFFSDFCWYIFSITFHVLSNENFL